ncbi:MAG: hypothetical protein IPG53_14140 [Ignavibacteriales bacterium]|nr:hypothetical protein [Ignavibacteriales bacterium]
MTRKHDETKIQLARIYAIKYKFQDQNTFKRLELIYSQGLISYTLYKNIVYFYNYLMNLRLKQNLGRSRRFSNGNRVKKSK